MTMSITLTLDVAKIIELYVQEAGVTVGSLTPQQRQAAILEATITALREKFAEANARVHAEEQEDGVRSQDHHGDPFSGTDKAD